MKKTINMQHEANLNAQGKLNSGKCKPVICLETGDVYTSQTDAAEAIGVHFSVISAHMCGRIRTVKGKHFCYVSRVNESLDSIVTRLRETSAMEDDARKWREYQAEQEAQRIAEEMRLETERKAKEKRDADIAKAQAKVDRRQAIRDRIAAELAEAEQRLMEAEKELEALEDEQISA